MRSEEGLTSFNKNHRVNFSGEKKKVNNEAFQGIYFLRIHEQLYVKSHLRSRPRLRILKVSIEYQFD